MRALFSQARATNQRLIGVGDLHDLLPLGRDAWKVDHFAPFAEALDGYPLDYVTGNHDPYEWVKQLAWPYENIKVHKSLTLDGFYFYHGHGWSMDWWLLQRFAPQVVEFMARWFPSQWYWISWRMGWTPGSDSEPPIDGETTIPSDAQAIVWRNAIKFATSHKLIPIVGHTHCLDINETALGFLYADCGDLKEGTFLYAEPGMVWKGQL